jgi:hypothetical protein
MSDMRSEDDILHERLENDLVAFGEFSAVDLMDHSIQPDDFTSLDGISSTTNMKVSSIKRSESSSSLKAVSEESGDMAAQGG